MRWTVAVVLLCAACGATAGQGPLQSPTQLPARIEPSAGGYDVTLSRSDQPLGQVFAAPVDRVWPLAVAAYTAAGLRIDGTDDARHLVQTRGQILRRQLAGRTLSTYFECGNELSGTIADTWRLTLSAHMGAGPGATPDSTRLQTMITVTASPVEGTSAQISPCSSKGRLEQEIAGTVRAALARK